jgi:hypothetical protein
VLCRGEEQGRGQNCVRREKDGGLNPGIRHRDIERAS